MKPRRHHGRRAQLSRKCQGNAGRRVAIGLQAGPYGRWGRPAPPRAEMACSHPKRAEEATAMFDPPVLLPSLIDVDVLAAKGTDGD